MYKDHIKSQLRDDSTPSLHSSFSDEIWTMEIVKEITLKCHASNEEEEWLRIANAHNDCLYRIKWAQGSEACAIQTPSDNDRNPNPKVTAQECVDAQGRKEILS